MNKTLTQWNRCGGLPATTSGNPNFAANLARRFLADERGATAIEYGLIVAGIAALLVGSLSLIGSSLSGRFNNVSTTLAK